MLPERCNKQDRRNEAGRRVRRAAEERTGCGIYLLSFKGTPGGARRAREAAQVGWGAVSDVEGRRGAHWIGSCAG